MLALYVSTLDPDCAESVDPNASDHETLTDRIRVLCFLCRSRDVQQNPAFDPTRSSNSISQLHLDILNGDDERIEPRDFLPCKFLSDCSPVISRTALKRWLTLFFFPSRYASIHSTAEISTDIPSMHTVMERRLGL